MYHWFFCIFVFPFDVPKIEFKISSEKPLKNLSDRTNFTKNLQTNRYFTNKFTNSTNKIQNTNGYKNIDIVIDIDIDILVNFVRFQRTEIYREELRSSKKSHLKISFEK